MVVSQLLVILIAAFAALVLYVFTNPASRRTSFLKSTTRAYKPKKTVKIVATKKTNKKK
ncbi:MAG: hypothetical protein ABIF08_02960 [Nanoarchaeota archaeon]